MTAASEFAEIAGSDYRPGNPVILAFLDGEADEYELLPLLQSSFPEAVVIAPHAGDGYDHDEAGRAAMAAFIKAQVDRLAPSRVVGLGYAGGADMLVSVMLEEPRLFSHAVLMHPMAPSAVREGEPLSDTRILVTAGGRDPLAPPDRTGQLIDGLEGRGATVKSVWHPGGHEIAANETEAVAEFMTTIRASLADPRDLPVEREQDDEGKGRYLVRAPGDAVAEMSYRHTGTDQLIIDHTEVPDAFRGTGTASRLLKTLLADARAEGRKIIPLCPYAAAQFERHPEWSDILAYRIRTKGS